LEATRHIIEEDSRYATRSYNQSEKTTLWVTNKGGEKRREVVHLQASSQELSTDYSGFSLATRLSMDRVDENILNFDLIEDLLQLLLLEQDKNSLLIAPDGANTPAGAVLIFLPGIGEIRALYDRLTSNRSLGNSPKFEIIPLHSKLSSADQRKAFLPSDSGARKIVLSTNIAESKEHLLC
jgi:HrpA-like RNA helicase